eukprot:6197907-Pleurochrysis_carterae.AAC.1
MEGRALLRLERKRQRFGVCAQALLACFSAGWHRQHPSHRQQPAMGQRLAVLRAARRRAALDPAPLPFAVACAIDCDHVRRPLRAAHTLQPVARDRFPSCVNCKLHTAVHTS